MSTEKKQLSSATKTRSRNVMQIAAASKEQWLEHAYRGQAERRKSYATISGTEIPVCITSRDLGSFDEVRKLGLPGQFPFTRGPQASMYRGRLWTMRQFAGFGSPDDTNARFHYLLKHGQTGLSTAFDMPTLMGYDADHPRSLGEVGREGVSVSTIADMDRLFGGIDLSAVTTSMTINCSAAPILAMYLAVARRRGISWDLLGGTIQNDILKEYIAQKEWISPPGAGLKLSCDIIEFCAEHARKFNPISISGYHIREAGSTAAQELAFTVYNGITYVEECLRRGMDVDSFAPRLSFFWDVHSDFFEEIAKFRAARRLWANIVKTRFGAKNPHSLRLRAHAQTAGVSLTAQQPLNNVARVAIQALAAVLGGTQSLHTNSMDETLALPTEAAVKVALRTQQIIAEETGVANTIDPLAGSYFVEYMTDAIEKEAINYINHLDAMGGMLKAIEDGFPQKEIAEAAYAFLRRVENEEQIIVGVNAYTDDDEIGIGEIDILEIDKSVEAEQVRRTLEFKNERDSLEVQTRLDALKKACEENLNTMKPMIEAVDIGVTLGEVCDVFREVYGVYTDPGFS